MTLQEAIELSTKIRESFHNIWRRFYYHFHTKNLLKYHAENGYFNMVDPPKTRMFVHKIIDS